MPCMQPNDSSQSVPPLGPRLRHITLPLRPRFARRLFYEKQREAKRQRAATDLSNRI